MIEIANQLIISLVVVRMAMILAVAHTIIASESSSGSIFTQRKYQLTVNVAPYPFGTSTVGISITTANGYTDQANVDCSWSSIMDIQYSAKSGKLGTSMC